MERPGKKYPSDLSAEQFDRIKPLLEGLRHRTRPPGAELREIFNAVLYVLKEGCSWRSLPHDYPCWSLVYYYFRLWRNHVDKQSGQPLLELALKKTGGRRPAGKQAARRAFPAYP